MPSDRDSTTPPPLTSAPGRRSIAGALAVFTVLAVVHTWPLASNPAHLSRNDTGDYLLNEWIVSWVAHQAFRDPLRLFEANIFYPEPNVLAFSEPLIVPGLMGAPVRWLGGSPVLTYNLLVLVGFVLSALAMYVCVASITGSHLAGLLAGSILAFNTHTLARIPHLQIVHAQSLPLALWAFDRVLTGARTRDALWLALFVVITALTSGYLAMFVAVALVTGFLVRPEDWWGPRARPVVGRLVLAAVVTGALALPVLWPYRQVREEQGLVRSLHTVARFSATPWAYLLTTSRLHYDAWSRQLYDRAGHEKFFPGFVVLGLGGVGLWKGRRLVGGPRVRMFVAIAGVGFVLSLGVHTPIYEYVYRWVPPLQSIRAVARFGYLVIFSIAALAGLGLAYLGTRIRSRPVWLAVAFGALTAANLEALHAPFEFRPFLAVSPVYDVLARERGRPVVAEFPLYLPEVAFRNADYVFNSTWHWHRLVNGYSGFLPQSYRRLARRVQEFPDAASLDALREIGVTHVMVHPGRYNVRRRRLVLGQLKQAVTLVKVTEDEDGVALYRLR